MKINKRVESIFAYAVAMDNRGLKNTIHCIGRNVFIVNFDHSMILHFPLRNNEVVFQKSISFNANDYDSSNFEEVDGKIVFISESKGYEKKKICGTSDEYDIQKLRSMFLKYIRSDTHFRFTLSSDVCSLLEEDLSHTEISVEEGKLILRQRNVYTGNIVEVSQKEKGLFSSSNALPNHFGPVGLKTKDFLSLFSFNDVLAFYPDDDYLIVKEEQKGDFDGILAFCKYDEILNLYNKDREEESINEK